MSAVRCIVCNEAAKGTFEGRPYCTVECAAFSRDVIDAIDDAIRHLEATGEPFDPSRLIDASAATARTP